MIIRINNHLHSNYEPSACAVYSLNCDEESIKNTQVLEHGHSRDNVNLKQPFIRTNKGILSREDELLRSKKRSAEVMIYRSKNQEVFFTRHKANSKPSSNASRKGKEKF